MVFDGLAYTREALAKELYLIELHSKDGSAFNAHCACIQEKHLLGVEGLAEEGVTLATNEKERKFYADLAQEARDLRKEILDETFGTKREKSKCDVCLESHTVEECANVCES